MSHKVLVVGGAGYIGSHMAHQLVDAGFTPIVFDNLSRGDQRAIEGIELFKGDLLDKGALNAVFSQHTFCCVLHFAALTEVSASLVSPEAFYQCNVQGSLELFSAMKRHGVDRLIFSSTAAVYGQPESTSISETAPLMPMNPYGRSKKMVEEILGDMVRAYGWSVSILRYFNAAGCDHKGRTGIFNPEPTHLIPVVLKAALSSERSFTIFGTDYPTPDGSCVRDFIHVEDLCSAHLSALKRLIEGDKGGIYNLGPGKGISVKEIIYKAFEVTGRSFTVHEGPRREGDPAFVVADSTKAQKEWGWKPVRSQPETLLQDTWAWYQKSAL